MLTRLALMFVLHVMAIGVLCGRGLNFMRMSHLLWVFAYLIAFHFGWGLFFAAVPQLIVPEAVP